jgi:hypothetical protein
MHAAGAAMELGMSIDISDTGQQGSCSSSPFFRVFDTQRLSAFQVLQPEMEDVPP